MYKMIAFDFDGTIADTLPMCIKAFQKSLSPYAGHQLKEDEITKFFGLDETGIIKAILGEENWQAPLEDYYAAYRSLHAEVAAPFPYIKELLAHLKREKAVTALITGKGEKSCLISLEKLGLLNAFEDILCGSEIAPNKKEHMEFLLKKYHMPKEDFCYIGDAVSDLEACLEVGVTCLSAAWQKSIDSQILEKRNSGHVFYQVEDLWHYLKA